MSAVQKRLEEFAEHMKENKNKTFIFELHKGNTRDILKDQGEWFDMAFIGGGNSIKTVAHDYDCVKKTPIVMLTIILEKMMIKWHLMMHTSVLIKYGKIKR